MNVFAQIKDGIKAYPYRRRLPFAFTMLCVFAWITYKSGPYLTDFDRRVDIVGTVALSLMMFCGVRGRLFWFFGGITIGVFFLEQLSKFNLF
jgi:hypothetical protein